MQLFTDTEENGTFEVYKVYEELQTDDKDETAELAVRCDFVIIFREVLIIILSK